MRKELGRPTRELFFARLAEAAPDFHRDSSRDIKGFTWSFLRRAGTLREWLWFQRHKYDDAFTVELSWSCLTDEPTRPRTGRPDDGFTEEGCRFRLGAFWKQGGDHWWYLMDPPPSILEMSPEKYVELLLERPPADLAQALPRVHMAVDDAIGRIREYALPYFDRVFQWAAAREARQ